MATIEKYRNEIEKAKANYGKQTGIDGDCG